MCANINDQGAQHLQWSSVSKKLTNGKQKMKLPLILTLFYLCGPPSYADHFNTGNLLDECRKDTSFSGACSTYVGAYKDLIGFLIFSTEERRDEIFCLRSVGRKVIVDALSEMTLRSTDPHRISDFLIKEFCK